jgi:hypothetical protein
MGWTGWVRLKKFWSDFVAWTFALVAEIYPILHRVLCSNKRIPNIRKHHEMHQNMSSGSNVVDRVCSLRKILKQPRGTNFCTNCTSSAQFAPSLKQYRNYRKCTQTPPNAPKHEFRVQWGGSFGKNSDATSWHELFALIKLVQPKLHWVSCSNEAIPNTPKHYETPQNMILGSNGVDRVHSLRKIPTQLRCTNYCTNCTSSAQSAPSFMH